MGKTKIKTNQTPEKKGASHLKTVTILKREIIERTGYKKYPFKQLDQIIIVYKNKRFDSNCWEDPKNPRLKKPFIEVFKTRSLKALNNYMDRLGRSDGDRWQMKALNELLKSVKGE